MNHETSSKPVDTAINHIFIECFLVFVLLHLEETSIFLNKTTDPKQVLNHHPTRHGHRWSLEQSVKSSMIFFVNAVLASVSWCGDWRFGEALAVRKGVYCILYIYSESPGNVKSMICRIIDDDLLLKVLIRGSCQQLKHLGKPSTLQSWPCMTMWQFPNTTPSNF